MTAETSDWLYSVSIIALAIAGACMVIIIFDILIGNRQHMWIMNLVWPITALWAGPIAL